MELKVGKYYKIDKAILNDSRSLMDLSGFLFSCIKNDATFCYNGMNDITSSDGGWVVSDWTHCYFEELPDFTGFEVGKQYRYYRTDKKPSLRTWNKEGMSWMYSGEWFTCRVANSERQQADFAEHPRGNSYTWTWLEKFDDFHKYFQVRDGRKIDCITLKKDDGKLLLPPELEKLLPSKYLFVKKTKVITY